MAKTSQRDRRIDHELVESSRHGRHADADTDGERGVDTQEADDRAIQAEPHEDRDGEQH